MGQRLRFLWMNENIEFLAFKYSTIQNFAYKAAEKRVFIEYGCVLKLSSNGQPEEIRGCYYVSYRHDSYQIHRMTRRTWENYP